MAKTTPPAPPPSAESALKMGVDAIRGWHLIGRESLEGRPSSPPPGSAALENEAGMRGINVATLRKLRQFADPKLGYTQAMLDRLCADCEKSGRALGIAFLMRLVSIPDRQLRRQIQTRLLKENWPLKRLNAEMRMRLGRQRAGGRHARIPADLQGMLAQLDGMIEPWTRLQQRMSAEASGGDPLRELPKKVREGFSRAVEGLIRLREEIQREAQSPRSRE